MNRPPEKRLPREAKKKMRENRTMRSSRNNDPGSGFESPAFQALLEEAWKLSRSRHGNALAVHIPGMFVVDGRRGRYRAVSITGGQCELDCEHCKGSLLRTMAHAPAPDDLLRLGRAAAARGDHGMLVTGGCDPAGRLPWKSFLPVMERLRSETDLIITVHAGQTDPETARALKAAGVHQALVDVMGDDATAREVYHLAEGTASIRRTMESLADAELEIVPHILFGIHYGREVGEENALEMLKDYPLRKYVVVVLMPTPGTPMGHVQPPRPEQVAAFIAKCRLELPDLAASLGCARPRGRYRRRLDLLAVKAGVNAIAIPADPALAEAGERGLEVMFHETCCSIG
jgi:uncharacterized radical SAM superfamily protein